MITMQITAPVGYGMRQMVAQLVQVRGLKAVWCSSLPEDRKRAEHSLGIPSITPTSVHA